MSQAAEGGSLRRTLAPQPQVLRPREPRCASSQNLWASLPSLPSVSSSQAPTSFRMTLDVGPEDELPDWAAAKEFYQKYDPKDIIGRGVSSVVRRCVHRATGDEFAVKIMEVSAERLSLEQLEEVRDATRREMHILRQVAGHPHISEAAFPAPAG